ncbi:MAG: hypothetical protein E6G56_11735, partial [Actinobacteria bacterium]
MGPVQTRRRSARRAHRDDRQRGGSSSRNDFGNYQPAAYTGTVFQDTNRNGVRDGPETGLSGWTVYVDYNNNGVKDSGEPSASTDSSGNYTISGVKPGSGYAVREVSQGSQWSCTTPSSCAYTSLSPTSGQTTSGENFGNAPTYSVSGTMFNDLNGNGVKDAGEPGLSGWTVYADLNGNGALDSGEPSATTAADGTYTITPINAGTMKIRTVAQSGWTATLPSAGYYPLTFSVTNGVPSANATGEDFGAYQPATVSGKVQNASSVGLSGWTAFVDYNANGVLDSGEPSATTDSSGNYTISSVKPGTGYQVGEILQAGFQCTAPTNCLYTSLSPTSGQAITGKDFTDTSTQTVQGTVYEDRNHNGAKDSGEPGLSGWTVYVDSNNNGVKDSGEPSANSAADGSYTITGVAASTTINLRMVSQANWTCDGPNSSCLYGTATSNSFQVASGAGATGKDFGAFQVNTVTGSVFQDDNANATKDSGEGGKSGWVAYVDSNNNGVKDSGEPSATTDANGNFEITSVTAQTNGKVRIVSQGGWSLSTPTTKDSGFTDPNYSLFTLASSSTAGGNNFGIYQTASVSGVKWEDRNRNGLFDSDEFGLSGIVIYADANGNGVLDGGEQSATTDSFGSYTISGLTPGSYTIREVVSSTSYTCTSPSPCSYSVTPTSGQSLTDKNFGNAPNNTFSGQQFHDKNANGTKDSGDGGLSGWVVYVDYNNNGVKDSGEPSATTDANGNYTISNVEPGTFTVREVSQTGWTCSAPSGCSYSQTFAAGTTATGKDFGTWQSASVAGEVFQDTNRNGALDSGEPGQSGRHVYLDTNNNGLFDSGEPDATTDASGNYTISGITPGTWNVREELQGLNVCSTPSPCYHSVTAQSQDAVTGQNFGNNDPGATIEGAVYDDQNNSGTRTPDLDGDGIPDEPGIAGVTVFVDYNANGTLDAGEPSATTGPYGDYSLTNVDAGTWPVKEILPSGYVCSTGGGCASSQTVVAGGYAGSVDFGNFSSDATGTVYEDLNANGVLDSGEPGLSGWTVYVDKNNNGVLDSGEPSATTGADGTYTLYDVPAGSPKIREVAQSGYTCSAPTGCVNTPAVTAGTPVSAQNFGDWTPASVSGKVFSDEDYSGTLTGGDTGLSGVRVFADLNNNGSWDSGEPSATTASDGTYTITGITPAAGIKIRAASVSGYTCAAPTGCLYTQTLTSHQSQTGDDFAEQPSRTVSGTQYEDLNANGVRDAGEPGLSGWVVYVDLNNNGAKDRGEPSATTAADGTYTISNVPGGTYNVREVAQSGYTCRAPSGCAYSLTWSTGSAFTGKDFGAYRNGSISGSVYEDKNANGVHDGSETSGLSGVTVYLDANGNGSFDSGTETSTTTDSTGAYSFTGLTPGSYTVREVLPSSAWHCSDPSSTFSSCQHAVTVTSGSTSTGQDFGDWQEVTTSGTVYHDLNADGSRQLGDNGISTRTVTLDPGTPGNALDDVTTSTDSNGAYSFTGLKPGVNYTVSTTLPAGWSCSQPSSSCSYAFQPSSGDGTITKDFGTYQSASVSGTVFRDSNANGTKDSGEPALSGRTVAATPSTGSAITTTTAADGTYTLTGLKPGVQYTISVSHSGESCSTPGGGCTYTATLSSGQAATGDDFGLYQTASVSGTVFRDQNANAAQDSGDSGLSGRTVTATPATGSAITTTTAADGTYTLNGLTPGVQYTISVSHSGESCSTPGGCTYTTTPTSGQTLTGDNFGLYQTASVSGTVYRDQNANGTQDSGDSGLSGRTVTATPLTGSAITTTSAADGTYTLNGLTPGVQYTISVTHSGETCSTPTSSDCTYTTTPTSGQTLTGDNFGLYATGQVSGRVWGDSNANGVFDSSSEAGLSGRTVRAVPPSGSAITTTTASDGTYTLTGLKPGVAYSIQVDRTTEACSTPDTGNCNYTETLSSGQTVSGDDFGLYGGASVSGTVFRDNNANATQDTGDSGLSGRTVTATPSTGSAIITTTASDGTYTLTGLKPGVQYTIAVSHSGETCLEPSGGCTYTATLSSGQTTTGDDFGLYQTASVSGTVYRDQNANATQDTGDSGLSGRTVTATPSTGSAITTTTASDGTYTLNGLTPGVQYTISVSHSGESCSTPGGACTYTTTPTSGQTLTGDNFGLYQTASISGTVYRDNNA